MTPNCQTFFQKKKTSKKCDNLGAFTQKVLLNREREKNIKRNWRPMARQKPCIFFGQKRLSTKIKKMIKIGQKDL